MSEPTEVTSAYQVAQDKVRAVLDAVDASALGDEVVENATKDTWLQGGADTANHGTATTMRVGAGTVATQRRVGLIEFPVGSLRRSGVTLRLYADSFGTNGAAETITVRRLRRLDWVETEATWRFYKADNDWGTKGGFDTATDIYATPAIESDSPTSAGWHEIDVSDLYNAAVDDEHTVLAIHMRTTGLGTNRWTDYRTREHATTSTRPELVYNDGGAWSISGGLTVTSADEVSATVVELTLSDDLTDETTYTVTLADVGSAEFTSMLWTEPLETPTLVTSSAHAIGASASATLTATKNASGGVPAEYDFYKDGVYVATVTGTESADYVIDYGSEGVWTAVAKDHNWESEPSTGVTVRVWVQVSVTQQTNNFEFAADSVVREGEYIFGEDTDFTRVFTGGGIFCDTGNGICRINATTGSGRVYANTWGAHDKRHDFEVEAELFLPTGVGTSFDAAILTYPSELTYTHAIKPIAGENNRTTGYVFLNGALKAPGYVDTTPLTAFNDWKGKWVPMRYVYLVDASGAATCEGKCFIDGTWRTTGPMDFVEDVYTIQNPGVGVDTWTMPAAGHVAWRNVRVISGTLAAYGLSPPMQSGNLSRRTIKVNGSGGTAVWTYDTNNDDPRLRHNTQPVDMYIKADYFSRIVIRDDSTDIDIELPVITKPAGLGVARAGMRVTNVDWRLVDALGGVLASGDSGALDDEVLELDLSAHASEPVFQLIITLKDSTSLLRWADISWDDRFEPADPTAVTAALTSSGAQVDWTHIGDEGYGLTAFRVYRVQDDVETLVYDGGV